MIRKINSNKLAAEKAIGIERMSNFGVRRYPPPMAIINPVIFNTTGTIVFFVA